MEPLLSIIIPVFNAEKRLSIAIESIIKQSFKNIELILVNDGSTDASGNICDSYALKDYRVRAIHQENAGVSAARNRGIKESRGDYITFIDSDDTLDLNAYETVFCYIDEGNHDMVIFGMSFDYYNGDFFSHSTILAIKENIKFGRDNLANHFFNLYQINYLSSVCNKVIRASVIKQNGIAFEENMVILEDFKFTLDILEHTNHILAITDPLYHYFNDQAVSFFSRRPEVDYLINFRLLDQKIRKFASTMNLDTEADLRKINGLIFRYYIIGIEKLIAGNGGCKMKYEELKRYSLDKDFDSAVTDAACTGKRLRLIHFLFRKRLTLLIFLMFWLNNYYMKIKRIKI